ncbi:hypothetical protein AB1Y20_019417 [Prymnesium parvum]|uniref:SAP domain-containing protein n=1 Tax=Prymnesium parvum TaxID=97485 RepID=A0AB34JSC3_PRYPA
MQLTPVKDEWFVNFDKSCYFKTAAFADITGGNIIRFHKYMRGDRDDPQGGKVVFDTYMRFNRFIKGVVSIPRDAVTSAVKSAKSARDMDGALRLINAPIETLKQQIRGMRMNDILHAVVQMVDEHGTHETFPCNGLTVATHDEISHDIPTMFPVTDETTVNIAYTHKTRRVVNSYYMNKYAALANEVVEVLAPTKTEEQLHKCQDVKLFAGAPIIAIRTVKKMKVYNAEMFDVVEFPRPPTGWHNATLTQLKDIAQKMCLPSSGNKAALVERIENKESAFVIRSRRSGEEIHVPLERFHDMFRIAYCITVHQSQGQTIRERYTIFDWYLPFLKDEERARAKYVALSRDDDEPGEL